MSSAGFSKSKALRGAETPRAMTSGSLGVDIQLGGDPALRGQQKGPQDGQSHTKKLNKYAHIMEGIKEEDGEV